MRNPLFFTILSTALFLAGGAASAAPIPSDLALSGSIDFDNSPFGSGNSYVNGGAANNGGITHVSGGVATTTTFDGLSTTGADPLAGVFTNINDAVRVQAIAQGNEDKFSLEVLSTLNFANNSLTDQYKIRLALDMLGTAVAQNSTGPDGVASKLDFTLTDVGAVSTLADLILQADTLGDNRRYLEVNGVVVYDEQLAVGGGSKSINQTSYLDIVLNPGASATLEGFWKWASIYADGEAVADLQMGIRIAEITNLTNPGGDPVDVPAPPGLALFGLGLLGLGLTRRRLKK